MVKLSKICIFEYKMLVQALIRLNTSMLSLPYSLPNWWSAFKRLEVRVRKHEQQQLVAARPMQIEILCDTCHTEFPNVASL